MALTDTHVLEFPAPREVDRWIYIEKAVLYGRTMTHFPAPPEVDRYLYLVDANFRVSSVSVSGPSRGR